MGPIFTPDKSTQMTLLIGGILTFVIVISYLINPFLIQFVNYKTTDAILAGSVSKESSGKVVVVDFDEKSLAKYGQWPWPRFRLASLIRKVQELKAKSIGLNMILAEPDRTSPRIWQSTIRHDLSYKVDLKDLPAELYDHDAALADTLTRGPFILGYEFLFEDTWKKSSSCRLHPLKIVWIKKRDLKKNQERFFKAKSVVCNLAQLSDSVSYSGFLNATPDSDGMLRRIPLLIRYENQYFPSLALAALMQAADTRQVQIRREKNGQSYLFLNDTAIPLDLQGNILVNFAAETKTVHRVSAADVLEDQVSLDTFRDKIVFVSTSASGLEQTYQTPCSAIFPQVEVHAQVVEAVLMERFIRRNREILFWEALFGIFIAAAYCVCLVRVGVVWNVVIGCLCILGAWQGSRIIFQGNGVLFSPLLPAMAVLVNYPALTIFKYWKKQHDAKQKVSDALVLVKASENKLNAIIKTVPDIIYRLDSAGKVTFLSPAISKYGRWPDELIGRLLLDLVAPDDRNFAVNRVNERRTGKRATFGLELRLLLTKMGPDHVHRASYFSVSAEGIYNNERPNKNSFLGTQGIVRDLTDRKKLESQLVRAQKMEVVSSLAGGIAHDLNNVLGGLVSYPELLLEEMPVDNPQRKMVEVIQNSGQRATAIVQDLLTLARRGVAVEEIINLNKIVREYLKSPEFDKIRTCHPNVRIRGELSEDLLNIKGSPVHLSKVVMNMVNNAAEAMPAGGEVVLRSDTRYLDAPLDGYATIPEGEYVRLSVVDSGVGISQQDLKRIFEPYYTKKRMGGSGTGLGMTIVWTTIKDLGGYVDVQSREGEGTRFDFYLPATREEISGEPERPKIDDYMGTERILVVDDIPEQCEIAVKMLSKLGYATTSATSGEAAVQYLEKSTADLIVLDMIMSPGIDGLETYQRIIARHPGQKAIIASGFSESDRVKALRKLGAGGYIRKPYTLEKIGLAIRKELDRK